MGTLVMCSLMDSLVRSVRGSLMAVRGSLMGSLLRD